MIEPEPCSVSRCKEPSLFSTVGLVDGRFYPQCHAHAVAWAQRRLADEQAKVDALKAVAAELPGQEALPL
jgi:hypothetical protein